MHLQNCSALLLELFIRYLFHDSILAKTCILTYISAFPPYLQGGKLFFSWQAGFLLTYSIAGNWQSVL